MRQVVVPAIVLGVLCWVADDYYANGAIFRMLRHAIGGLLGI